MARLSSSENNIQPAVNKCVLHFWPAWNRYVLHWVLILGTLQMIIYFSSENRKRIAYFCRGSIPFTMWWQRDLVLLEISLFLTHHMKNARLCYEQCWAGRVIVLCCKNFSNVAIFSDTVNVINIKLCMMLQLIGLYLCIPLSVSLTICQGQRSVKQF